MRTFEELDKKLKGHSALNELMIEAVGCLLENAFIHCTLALDQESKKR